MTDRRQKVLSTLSSAGKQLARTGKGVAINVGSTLAESWHYMREQDRLTYGPKRAVQQPPANTDAAPKKQEQQAAQKPTDAAAKDAASVTQFQQLLSAMAQTYKVPDNDTQLLDALKNVTATKIPTAPEQALQLTVGGLLFDLTPHEIHTEAEGLNETQALRMIRFAAANPSMRKNGITIDGSDADRKLLSRLAADAGLKVLNPVQEPQAPVIEQPAVIAPTETPVTTEAPADKKPAEPLVLPLPENISKILAGGSVPEETYRTARDFVVAQKKANPNMLQTELGITRAKAKTILNALAIEGIVKIDEIKMEKKETLKTVYTVASTADNVTVAATGKPDAEKAAKPDADKPAAPGPA